MVQHISREIAVIWAGVPGITSAERLEVILIARQPPGWPG